MKQKFSAEIKKRDGIDGAYIEIPFDVEAVPEPKGLKHVLKGLKRLSAC
jgi:hypothetical protein